MRKIAHVLAAVALASAIPLAGAVQSPAYAATCTTSSADGGCGPYHGNPAIYEDVNGSPDVANDVWNQSAHWSQALTASGLDNWSVAARMDNGNTAVVSYPDSQVTYTLTDGTTPSLANFGDLASSWRQSSPAGPGQDYEWAYDIWLNPAGQQSWGGSSGQDDQEIMIWTDNHGQRPAGNDTGKAYTDAAGTGWEIWLDKGGCSTCTADNDHIVTYVRQGNATSGALDLSGFLANLTASGYTIGNDGQGNPRASIDQVGYGVELCSTGGATLTYALTGYTLTKNGGAPAPTPTPTATTPAPTPTPTPTSAPALAAPGNLSQTPHVIVNFGWAPVAGATGYELQLRLAANGMTVADVTSGGPAIGGTEVSKDTRYQWRVRATGGPWSAWRSFTSP